MSRRHASDPPAAVPPKLTRLNDDLPNSRPLRDLSLAADDNPGRRNFVSDSDFDSQLGVVNNIDSSTDSVLQPIAVDLQPEVNPSDHFTSQYELPELVVRRGQAFTVTLIFSRDYNPQLDQVLVQFTYGSRPQESKGTVVRLPVQATAPSTTQDWCVWYSQHAGTSLEVFVLPPADAIVGRYKVFVETGGAGDKTRKEFDETFIVLFNAWCKDDVCYMENSAEREEYVMNERGRLWQGTAVRHAACAWNYGQFEDVVLEGALYLLDKAELGDAARSNPVQVTRCISAMSNSNDADGGVLTGRWTDTYPKDCTVPWAWTGSVAIMEEFMRNKRAVKYGQCWVFSAIVTSLLRSLGLATRSVTNFESAHDTDASMTIDYHWGEDDNPLGHLNDSVWNFHVWNESWMERPDLPAGYGGWQAHDATPQELSEGVMRCGPASVKAIKEGEVYFNYDAPFIFAEVNGDKVYWEVKKDGSMEVLYKDTRAVGQKISTKAVGSNDRLDLTSQYKHPADSEAERRSVQRAFRHSSRRHHQVYDVPAPDVTFTLNAPDDLMIGNDFLVTVDIQNQSSEVRHVVVRLTAVSSYYTGVMSEQVGTKVFTLQLQPNQASSCSLPISAADYEGLLKPDSMVTMYLKGTVKETGRSYAHIDSFPITKPRLTLKAPERVSLNEEFDLTISFTNPLNLAINGGVFHIEAPGIARGLVIPYQPSIPAGGSVTHTVSLTATRAGGKEISVNFSSDQMSGLTGETEIYVSYAA